MSALRTRESLETRERILVAAEKLFRRHGYLKTTIVEIAAASTMSHANVYRFFRNKDAIVNAIAARWLERSMTIALAVAEREAPARERLIDCILELHAFKRRESARGNRIRELITRAVDQGRPYIAVHDEAFRAILAGIVADGVASGEFRAVDPAAIAIVVAAATMKFLTPDLVARFAKQHLEAQARAVMTLLADGLRATG